MRVRGVDPGPAATSACPRSSASTAPTCPPTNRRQATEFIERDLEQPLAVDRRFNLAICLEVGEHLPPERAPGFVADLTSLAPVVLFSAAVPGQGGTHHVNEQWSEYWVALFEAEGWVCRDAVRPWIRSNEDVAWWYRQNLYLAISPTVDAAYSSFPRLAAGARTPSTTSCGRGRRDDPRAPPPTPDQPPSAEPGDRTRRRSTPHQPPRRAGASPGRSPCGPQRTLAGRRPPTAPRPPTVADGSTA